MSQSESIVQGRVGLLMQPLSMLVQGLLRIYRVAVSPLLGPCCRFAPSCSAYAAQAIQRHGLVRGTWLALRRLLRCHPFHPGGWDPVR
jgi:putative membrane protein insertion efficiency factor